jgi:hypothetical protein
VAAPEGSQSAPENSQSSPAADHAPPAPTVAKEARPDQPHRHGARRHRGRRDDGGARHDGRPRGDGQPREARPPEERPREGEFRKEDSRGPRARDDRAPRENRGPRGPKDRRPGKDRDGFRKKPEPKLYSVESVVDHGFEEVADANNDGETRRVDWTIVKRMTADQRTARALSAIYVVNRDGVATEFAQLSAARAAVNKTIVHPEKLTKSKADHATAKGAKK